MLGSCQPPTTVKPVQDSHDVIYMGLCILSLGMIVPFVSIITMPKSSTPTPTLPTHVQTRNQETLGERGQLTGGYMLIILWFFKQFVHTFLRGDMLITF